MGNKKRKKPDLVVWNEEKGYYSRELTYGTNIGAPAIKKEDVVGWKDFHVNKANQHFRTRYEELKDQYSKLIDEINWNELVYKSAYNFIPVIGETYHLYIRDDNTTFLSLITPTEWNQKYIGSFKLDSSQKWIKVDF